MWAILKEVCFMHYVHQCCQTISRTLISIGKPACLFCFTEFAHGYIYIFGQYTDIALVWKSISFGDFDPSHVPIHCIGQFWNVRSFFSSEVTHEAHADRMLQGILQSDSGGDHHPWWHQAVALCHPLRHAHVGETHHLWVYPWLVWVNPIGFIQCGLNELRVVNHLLVLVNFV